MDYIPVYAEEETSPSDHSIVKISVEKVQRAGVRTEVVKKHVLSEPLSVPGTVAMDERRERSITIRNEGFIEKVYAGVSAERAVALEERHLLGQRAFLQLTIAEARLDARNGSTVSPGCENANSCDSEIAVFVGQHALQRLHRSRRGDLRKSGDRREAHIRRAMRECAG